MANTARMTALQRREQLIRVGRALFASKSDVLKFLLEDDCSIVVRPSGTEPKLKIYISVSAENREAAEKVECEIVKDAEKWFA